MQVVCLYMGDMGRKYILTLQNLSSPADQSQSQPVSRRRKSKEKTDSSVTSIVNLGMTS